MKGKITLLVLFVTFQSFAKDLGQYGTVYPINETPADQLIEKRIQNISNEDRNRIETLFREKVQNRINQPIGKKLPNVEKAQSRLFNPSILFSEPIIDPSNEKIIAKAGTQVNPLDYVTLKKPLIFFDGNDEAQVQWVNERHSDSTLIIVNGEPLRLQKRLNRQIYFDQKGKLIERFSIRFLPTLIRQEGKLLRIEECLL